MKSKQTLAASMFAGVVACTGGSLHPSSFEGRFPDGPGFVEDDTRPVVQAADPPPPISGGTLVISQDGRTAIAADPDHDLVWRVDLRAVGADPSVAVLSATALEPGDEPGRVVEDATGRIHVALRRGGAIASFDPNEAQDVRRTPVCPEPRGLAYEASTDRLHVACTNGELVTLPAGGGPEVRRLQLEPDLRDVVVRSGPYGDRLVVSRFRSAELLEVDADGVVAVDRMRPQSSTSFDFDGEPIESAPAVAWRMVSAPDGSIEIAHQRASGRSVSVVEPGGYGGGFDDCSSPIVQSATSRLERGSWAPASSAFRPGVVLPVDVAVSPDGDSVAIASAGTRTVWIGWREDADAGSLNDGDCMSDFGNPWSVDGQFMNPREGRQPIAVAWPASWDDGNTLVVQLRDPSAILLLRVSRAGAAESAVVTRLPALAVSDSGHQTFHESASAAAGEAFLEGFGGPAPLACASCHPEGREDARTWNFAEIGPRRTQSVAGGVLATEPLHWDGDMDHFATLIDSVFVNRMGGPRPQDMRVSAIGRWIDSLPPPHLGMPVDASAAERGRALFEDEDVGCTDCHSGARMTNNQSMDVGTGGTFQVPSLVGVSARAPFLHDGRAATLHDRFRSSGEADRHGRTSHLTSTEIDDLVAYLETL